METLDTQDIKSETCQHIASANCISGDPGKALPYKSFSLTVCQVPANLEQTQSFIIYIHYIICAFKTP